MQLTEKNKLVVKTTKFKYQFEYFVLLERHSYLADYTKITYSDLQDQLNDFESIINNKKSLKWEIEEAKSHLQYLLNIFKTIENDLIKENKYTNVFKSFESSPINTIGRKHPTKSNLGEFTIDLTVINLDKKTQLVNLFFSVSNS